MNGSNFTNKAQRAILSAQNIVQERGQQQVDALHLLLALLLQEESIVLTLLQKLGVDIDNLKKKAEASLGKVSRVGEPQSLGQLYLTQDMAKILDRARKEAMKIKDEFVSIEHLFLALLDVKTKAKEVLDKAVFLQSGDGGATTLEVGKLDYETVLKNLAQIRGGERITDPEPESKYQVIEKYARNLTQLALQGKLDPVIGREKEIRRLMQVLSRSKAFTRFSNSPRYFVPAIKEPKSRLIISLSRRLSGTSPLTIF